ncbi:MAG: acyl-ACP--UDP-N-acetylglucosamine O-acyltransferase [Ignavibacteria bacterium]|nr:acyl-ACP--UDP-N-acetylglucosamine O-acyltransferase [Ignavibacteria bacterium]
MSNISEKAEVSPKAVIGNNVSIGPFSVIESSVNIGSNTEIHSSVVIHSGTTLASGVRIFHSAVLGAEPQDLKFSGEVTTLEIGEKTVVREFATISRGTIARGKTIIGRNCYIMNYVHIPHDSVIGNNVILSNAINMGGHVTVDDWAIIGGMVGIHQFVHIGAHSFIAFGSRVTQDVPPYILAGGSQSGYKGLNIVGLKRRGFTDEQIRNIKNAYSIIFGSEYNISDAVKAVKDSTQMTEEVKTIISFIEQSERGIIRK